MTCLSQAPLGLPASPGIGTHHSLFFVPQFFTGLLAAQRIQEGKFDPNMEVIQYLPEKAYTAWAEATV